MDIELKIEKLVFGGDGLGFVDGKACFVEGALPGSLGTMMPPEGGAELLVLNAM